MRIVTRLIVSAIVLFTATVRPVRADDADDPKIRKSVVKIFANLRELDPFRPWTFGDSHDVTGSGVVIAGKRILTNAHVVNHARQIFIQAEKSSEKLSVKVEVLAPGIDLAVLKVDDESFFESHPPLPVNSKVPSLQQTTFVYGYPEGGSELSITRGIVSRVEYAEYYLRAEGLRVQVDAAINPGNSGGPAVANGQLIGIAFSRLQRSDNIGYIIPMEEIELFLTDVKDGTYNGKPTLEIDIQKLENDALRSRMKLDKKASGVLVRRVRIQDASYPLKVNDVITKVGEHAVDNAGMVHVEEDRLVRFQYLVQRLAHDGRLKVTVLREGKEAKLDLPVKPLAESLYRSLARTPPSYFVFGPLVFTEASNDYVRSVTTFSNEEGGGNFSILGILYAGNPLLLRYGDRPAFKDERLVIIAHPMLTHKLGKGYDDAYTDSVAQVNGVHVRNLEHLVEIIRDATGDFIEFTFHGNDTDMIVFKRQEAIDATEEILNENSIRHQCSPDIAPIWNKKK